MKTFAELKRAAAIDGSGLPTVRVAVLADSATQFLATALRGTGVDRGLNLEVHEAPHGRIAATSVDIGSGQFPIRAEIVLVWQASEHLLSRFQTTPIADREAFANRCISEIEGWIDAIRSGSDAKIIYMNAVEIDDGAFGSFATRVPRSWVYQLRRFNYVLMETAARRGDFLVCDLAMVAAQHDRAFVCDARLAATMDVRLSLDMLPIIASRVLDIIDATRGRIHKCLILDLDNTLWGGVIGDDGMDRIEIGALGVGHVFDEIQAWAKSLKERGIILAVASKNEHQNAIEPFEKHPDMTLRLEDISVFVANWEQKAANIEQIRTTLDIGYDSMVFLDDNPAERAAVRMHLPDVCVPELPEDPAEWLPALRAMNLFETTSYTAEDQTRTQQYQAESQRQSARSAYADASEFLRSLEMVGTIEGITSFNLPRVAQLTQRSNQFNLRTVRYDEQQIAAMAASPSYLCFAVTLADRFGAHGLISVVIARDAGGGDYFVDTWLMSCRVLQRGVERFVLDALCNAVLARNGARIVGEHIPTAKNGLVRDHYAGLGFTERDGRWYLSVDQHTHNAHFIRPASLP